MAFYFRCSNCHTKFIDYFGEYAYDRNILSGAYECPKCKNLLYDSLTFKEYEECDDKEFDPTEEYINKNV